MQEWILHQIERRAMSGMAFAGLIDGRCPPLLAGCDVMIVSGRVGRGLGEFIKARFDSLGRNRHLPSLPWRSKFRVRAEFGSWIGFR